MFTDLGLVSIPEGAKYHNLELVLLVYGEIADGMCRDSKITSVTAVFVNYSDANNSVHKRVSSPVWSETEVEDTQTQILELKQKSEGLFV